MTHPISDKELKKPDAFLQKGRTVVFYLEKYHRWITATAIVVIAVVAGIMLFNQQMNKKELALQTEYYKIEKSYLKKKENLEKKNSELDALKKDSKSSVVGANSGNTPNEDTYKDELTQFNQLMQKDPTTQAALMAALVSSEIYNDLKQYENAQKALESVYNAQKKFSIMKSLVGHSLGTILANLGKCDQALRIWEGLAAEKKLGFMADELNLKMAICHQQLGQGQKAEELLSQLKAKTDSPQGRAAEKYIRYLKLHK